MTKFSIKKAGAALLAAGVVLVGLTACEGDSAGSSDEYQEQQKAATTDRDDLYKPHNNVEYNNYNEAQKLYDDPNTIQWCTAAWSNDSAPLFTVPIKGKLTSSSVSYFPNTEQRKGQSDATWNPELRSVDGMYHGNPPAYRYGFTPAGQYVDFSGMEVMCTTSPTKFQRESSNITFETDEALSDAQRKAEDLLKQGKGKEAQQVLEDASSN